MRRAVLLVLLLLPSCYQPDGFPPQPPLTAKPYLTDTLLHVVWIKDVGEIPSCNQGANVVVEECAVRKVVGTMSFCTIYAFMPKDFNDFALLARLGHEVWHCLGAEHQVMG